MQKMKGIATPKRGMVRLVCLCVFSFGFMFFGSGCALKYTQRDMDNVNRRHHRELDDQKRGFQARLKDKDRQIRQTASSAYKAGWAHASKFKDCQSDGDSFCYHPDNWRAYGCASGSKIQTCRSKGWICISTPDRYMRRRHRHWDGGYDRREHYRYRNRRPRREHYRYKYRSFGPYASDGYYPMPRRRFHQPTRYECQQRCMSKYGHRAYCKAVVLRHNGKWQVRCGIKKRRRSYSRFYSGTRVLPIANCNYAGVSAFVTSKKGSLKEFGYQSTCKSCADACRVKITAVFETWRDKKNFLDDSYKTCKRCCKAK